MAKALFAFFPGQITLAAHLLSPTVLTLRYCTIANYSGWGPAPGRRLNKVLVRAPVWPVGRYFENLAKFVLMGLSLNEK